VAMGVGLRPTAKALDKPPNPKVHAPQIYPDRGGQSLGAISPNGGCCAEFIAAIPAKRYTENEDAKVGAPAADPPVRGTSERAARRILVSAGWVGPDEAGL
jgi:hypothetical protein